MGCLCCVTILVSDLPGGKPFSRAPILLSSPSKYHMFPFPTVVGVDTWVFFIAAGHGFSAHGYPYVMSHAVDALKVMPSIISCKQRATTHKSRGSCVEFGSPETVSYFQHDCLGRAPKMWKRPIIPARVATSTSTMCQLSKNHKSKSSLPKFPSR